MKLSADLYSADERSIARNDAMKKLQLTTQKF
jgi:hypothetical protein